MKWPFSFASIFRLLKTRLSNRLITVSAQQIRCFKAARVSPCSVAQLPRYITDCFQGRIRPPTVTIGKLARIIVPGRWKQISSHFFGDKRKPNGSALCAMKSSIFCIPSAVKVNKIWSSAYSRVARCKVTSLMPSNDKRKDQLINDKATVKKLGDAGQPCLTPRFRSNNGQSSCLLSL